MGVIFVFSGPVLPDQFKKTFAFKGCGNCCQLKKQLVGGLIGNPLETVFETFYDSLRTLLDLLLETLEIFHKPIRNHLQTPLGNIFGQ